MDSGREPEPADGIPDAAAGLPKPPAVAAELRVRRGGRSARAQPVFERRPDSPRRRVVMLLLITLVALIPIAVGLVVGQLT
ncbi:MAG: hypothetical protein ACRDWV_11385 [Acidimicrobiales bacterium]